MKRKDSPLWGRLLSQLFEILGVKDPRALQAIETGNTFASIFPIHSLLCQCFTDFKAFFFFNEYL